MTSPAPCGGVLGFEHHEIARLFPVSFVGSLPGSYLGALPVKTDTSSASQPSPALAGAHPITLPCGTALWLLPQRAVWWPAAHMAFVADVHFGKAATFRHAGLPVPSGTTGDNLARLDAVLQVTAAKHLVFLGDFLHARPGADAALWAQLIPWRERHADVQMTLVRGNHDQHAGDPPQALGMALVDEPWRPVEGAHVLACHHPQFFDEDTVLAGHLHPTARLFGRARDSLRLPCFAWASGLVVLPAFGAFTGSAPDHLPAHTQRFVVTDDAVHRI